MTNQSSNKSIVLHIASGDVWGGAEAQLYLLFSEIIASAGESEVSFASLLLNDGVLSERLKQSNILLSIADESKGFLHILKSAITFARTQNIKLIVAHGYKECLTAFIISLYLRKPWILQVHGSTENYSGFAAFKANLYFKAHLLIARLFASNIIFVSEALKNNLGFEKSGKAKVIHNAATINTPPPVDTLNTSDLKKNDLKLVLLGRLSPVKRPDIALDSFKYFQNKYPELKNVTLHFIGDGPLEEELRNHVKTHNIKNVVFEGFLKNPSNLLTKNTVLLLTSDSEGLPTAILEAVHAGIPVLTRDVGGIKEISMAIPKYPIIFCSSSKPEDIAEDMFKVLSSFSVLINNAQNIDTGYFLPSRMLKDHLTLYKNHLHY